LKSKNRLYYGDDKKEKLLAPTAAIRQIIDGTSQGGGKIAGTELKWKATEDPP
jgi:hypothetical protein